MKRLLSFALVLSLLAALLLTPASAAEPSTEAEATPYANALYEAGLFNGTGNNADGTPNFALDKTATRAEALVMLVRILGKEDEAAQAPASPFTDVPSWATAQVNYAYANHLTNGVSSTLFGSNQTITKREYLVLCLRALGYQDGADFSWDDAYHYARDVFDQYIPLLDDATQPALRANLAIYSARALNAKVKVGDETLAQHSGLSFRCPRSLSEQSAVDQMYLKVFENGHNTGMEDFYDTMSRCKVDETFFLENEKGEKVYPLSTGKPFLLYFAGLWELPDGTWELVPSRTPTMREMKLGHYMEAYTYEMRQRAIREGRKYPKTDVDIYVLPFRMDIPKDVMRKYVYSSDYYCADSPCTAELYQAIEGYSDVTLFFDPDGTVVCAKETCNPTAILEYIDVVFEKPHMTMTQVVDAIHTTKNSEELVTAFEKLWRWWE